MPKRNLTIVRRGSNIPVMGICEYCNAQFSADRQGFSAIFFVHGKHGACMDEKSGGIHRFGLFSPGKGSHGGKWPSAAL